MNYKKIRNQHYIQLIVAIFIVIAINVISSLAYFRLDLSEDKKYSLSESTVDLLDQVNDVVYVKVYLDGELPSNFRRLQKNVRELLGDFRRYSSYIEYEIIDINKEEDLDNRYAVYRQLQEKGLLPTQLEESASGAVKHQVIFPGALVVHGDVEIPVNFLVNDGIDGADVRVNKSIARLEERFMVAIREVVKPNRKKIAFIEGHGELSDVEALDAMVSLNQYYDIDRLKINGVITALDEYDAIVVAKPNNHFNEDDKFIIDQYIMKGGKVLWFVEWMQMDMDSLATQVSSMALLKDFNLDDLLYKYGVRINPDLIQDVNSLSIPVTVNQVNGKPKFEPRKWLFFPAVFSENNHIINNNISVSRTQFVSSIDTVGEDPRIKKIPLLKTSEASRTLGVPVEVNLSLVSKPLNPAMFNSGRKTIAVLLEGEFESNYVNRIPRQIAESKEIDFRERSVKTSQIVFSDGDYIRNNVKHIGTRNEPDQLGADRFYRNQFTPGNKEMVLNSVNYLCGDEDIINLRMREVKLRLLDQNKVYKDGTFWIVFNTAVPIVIVLLFGFVLLFVRRYRFGKK